MSELLLELFSEEIPAMMQGKAADSYKKIFTNYFSKLDAEFNTVEVHAGARRITIYVNGLQSVIPSSISEIRGPKISAPEKAIEGFCRSHNTQKSSLEIKNISGTEFYFFIKKINEKRVFDLLKQDLSTLISEYVWPKSMHWGDYKIKWVRPLHNILCIFDGQILPFRHGHLTANNLCYGHKFMSPKVAEISSYEEYKKHLRDNYVIFETKDRTMIIQKGLKQVSSELNLVVKEDPNLLEEVAGLVEYPKVLIGKIDKKFLQVPSEILVDAMKTHQRYFSVFDQNGHFAPYFVFVANIISSQEELVISGNERVLSARLADALYFYNQDLKTTLEQKKEKLHRVTFHSDLGTLYDKVKRLEKLCDFISPDNNDLQKAASLCKSDIVSEVVDEFPSLQGIMGYHYAVAESHNKNINEAIRDHYKPQGVNDQSPKGYAAILALADKLDSLCGLILAGEKPSGSKDPYALRRNALGIIRIILENKLAVNLKSLVEESLRLCLQNYSKTVEEDKKIDIIKTILKFLEERVKHYFKNDYSLELILSSLDFKRDTNLINCVNKIEALNKFISQEQGRNLLQSYKRINNLLGQDTVSNTIDNSLFSSNGYEAELFDCIKYQDSISTFLKQNLYENCLNQLVFFNTPLTNFFENILVKDKDPLVANNRMALLQKIRNIFDQVAKFDKL